SRRRTRAAPPSPPSRRPPRPPGPGAATDGSVSGSGCSAGPSSPPFVARPRIIHRRLPFGRRRSAYPHFHVSVSFGSGLPVTGGRARATDHDAVQLASGWLLRHALGTRRAVAALIQGRRLPVLLENKNAVVYGGGGSVGGAVA